MGITLDQWNGVVHKIKPFRYMQRAYIMWLHWTIAAVLFLATATHISAAEPPGRQQSTALLFMWSPVPLRSVYLRMICSLQAPCMLLRVRECYAEAYACSGCSKSRVLPYACRSMLERGDATQRHIGAWTGKLIVPRPQVQWKGQHG